MVYQGNDPSWQSDTLRIPEICHRSFSLHPIAYVCRVALKSHHSWLKLSLLDRTPQNGSTLCHFLLLCCPEHQAETHNLVKLYCIPSFLLQANCCCRTTPRIGWATNLPLSSPVASSTYIFGYTNMLFKYPQGCQMPQIHVIVILNIISRDFKVI